MNKKLIMFNLCLCTSCILTGCSLFPKTSSTEKIEKIAKQCINSDIVATGAKASKEDSGAGKYIYYPMRDARGIEFNIIADNRYIAIVEPIPGIYSGNVTYFTDYKKKIIAYYQSDIEDIIKQVNTESYKINGGSIEIVVMDNEDLSKIVNMIMELDELLAFDFNCNDIISEKLGPTEAFSGYTAFDLLISMRDESSGQKKTRFYESLLFSDNNDVALTYDSVLKHLSLAYDIKANGNDTKVIRVNGDLYYDSGEVTDVGIDGPADGTTTARLTHLPQKDDQTNFGAGVDYQFGPDNELFVFLSDGRHVFLKY